MEPTSKLRVVTADAPEALRVIRQEVEEATGLAAQPEIQEVERSELVVELRLAGATVVAPGLVARRGPIRRAPRPPAPCCRRGR